MARPSFWARRSAKRGRALHPAATPTPGLRGQAAGACGCDPTGSLSQQGNQSSHQEEPRQDSHKSLEVRVLTTNPPVELDGTSAVTPDGDLPSGRRPSPKFNGLGIRITIFEACSVFTHANYGLRAP